MLQALHLTQFAYIPASAAQGCGFGICLQRWNMDPERIRAAIAGDAGAIAELLSAATPVVQARVARALLRRPETRGRDIHADVADLTQEVFVALFTADGKALKAWDPARGLSFANFVGLLAQRRVSSLL